MPDNTYSGSALVVTWAVGTAAAGTLTGLQRSFSYAPSINLIDSTAGADANKRYISGVKDGQAQFEALMPSGTNAPGTAAYAACVEGASGTVVYHPEGVVVGKPKITLPAISMGASFSYPYEDVVTVSVPFQQNGARVEGTN